MRYGMGCLGLVVGLTVAPLRGDGIMQTLVGVGAAQSGTPALGAVLGYTGNMVVDAVGTIYYSDMAGNRIMKIDPVSGVVSTLAGTGDARFGGDNGPATAASFYWPTGLALTSDCLLVADSNNNRIRRIHLSTGIIDTVAGNGTNSASSSTSGQPTLATVGDPSLVCADGDAGAWIYDNGGAGALQVQYFTIGQAPDSIVTVAGDGAMTGNPTSGDGGSAVSASLYSPISLAYDPVQDALDIATDFRIRRVSNPRSAAATITSVAGTGMNTFAAQSYAGGPAASALLGTVAGMVVDPSGNLFISDGTAKRVLRLDAVTHVFTSVAGDGVNEVTDDGGLAAGAGVGSPAGLGLDGNGDLYVDTGGAIRRIDAVDKRIHTVAGGSAASSVAGPGSQFTLTGLDPSVAALPGGDFVFGNQNYLWRYAWASGQVSLFAGNGSFYTVGNGGPATAAAMGYPYGMALDAVGDLYVDASDDYVRRIDPQGISTIVVGVGGFGNGADGVPGTSCAVGQAFAMATAPGKLYLANTYFSGCVIRVLDTATNMMGTLTGQGGAGFVDGPVATAQLGEIHGMAYDPAGFLYCSDRPNNAIRRVDLAALTVTTICGLGPLEPGYLGDGYPAVEAALNGPNDLWLDAQHGLLIADSGNDRIRRIDLGTGIITTVVGDGFVGFAGDGGPALSATLHGPTGLLQTPLGDIVCIDAGNSRIRWVDYAKPTPVSSSATRPVAYPSPAKDRVCLSYWTQSTGHVSVEVFNLAFQLAARFDDDITMVGAQLTCADVRGLSNGAYLYRIHPSNGGAVQSGKFKVIH